MSSAEKRRFGQLGRRSPGIVAVAIATALAGLGASWAQAAGLGRLTVQSGLGQPLRAEVEITALSREEAASLSARLAPAEAFRQAGLEFNPALGALRFAIDRRGDGSAVVRITSNQPINEPFVDLLVELNWASGKFVREYTFLLDPPELRSTQPQVAVAPVIPPAVTMAPAPSAAPESPPAASAASPAAQAPAAPARAAAPAPTPAPARERQAAARSAAPADAAGSALSVRAGDTLASIAGRVKPADVSLEQAIIAIYKANPGAFFGSVHQLRAGASLTVPDRAAMQAVDTAEARRQIRAQAADFAAYRERLASATRRVETASAGQSASGAVTGRVEETGPATSGGDQLRLSRSQGEAAAGAAAGAAGARSGANAETQVAREAALREQQERIAALEKNVADLQQLVELKNRQMAELQRQVEAARAAGTSASGTIAAPAAGAASGASGAASSGTASTPAASAAGAASPVPPTAAPGTASAPATAPSASAPAVAPEPAAAAPAPSTPPTAAPGTPATQPAAAPAAGGEPSFIEGLLANPLTLPAVGAIVLALGLYGLYAVRRRRKTEKFEDSLSAADAFTANSLFGSTGGQAVDTNNSMFASNIRDSGVDVHSTEVDPIAEAEVYIAYGREAQAEEILKEALKKQPDRQAIRLKLLEIYAGRKDVLAFGALAQEMYDMTGGQNEEWPKVVTLGLSIDPANPLYTGQGEAPAAADEAPAPDAAPKADAGAQTGAAVAGLSAAATAAALVLGDRAQAGETDRLPPIEGLDTPLPSTFAETVPMDGEQPAVEEMPALDFNLDIDTMVGRAGSRLGAEAAEPAAQTSEEQVASDLARAIDGRFELPSLDLDLGKSAAATPAEQALEAEAEPPALADLGDFKIDLPSLEGLDRRPAAGAADTTPAIDMGGEDLGLAISDADPAPSADSARWQEMATKLDLASAYEEIGDKEGARELLEEVLKGGDAGQQQKARTMLSKIG